MSEIEIIETEITGLLRKRTIRVCLPKGYRQETGSYPVLYMHDGHNLFTKETSSYGSIWDAAHAADLHRQKYGKGIITVGIDADPSTRLEEYSPWVSRVLKKYAPELNDRKHGGEGDAYLDWIVSDLVPLIQKRYRTDGHSYMAGSSMGALISLYAGEKYEHVFEGVGCFSGAWWFAKKEMVHFLKCHHASPLRVYLDCGTKETGDTTFDAMAVKDTVLIHDMLEKYKTKDIRLIIEEGANHSETSWARRFPGFLEWLLKI